ncbi:MAG: Transposase [Cenarchaeum symbiont of Oopsacas minuta]|nr:Transposase [Cenarchaeum symbiont of Oopsacas minuta]
MHRKIRTLEGCKNKNKKRSGHHKTKKQTKSLPHFDRSYMYVGIDVHKEFLQVAMMDKKGKIVFNERVDRDNDEVKKFFLKNVPKSAKCIMESSSVWYGLFTFMTKDLKLDVSLSNPYQTKAIASSKKKTDKIDAMILADLYRGGYIALCHVPTKIVVEWRRLVRHRHWSVQMRTSEKNAIHGILLQEGIKIAGTTFTQKYNESLHFIGDYRIDESSRGDRLV